MKKHYVLNSILAGVALAALVCSSANAIPYGTNITIFDGKSPPTGTGVGGEDNEAEPGMVQAQVWDLEGFFLKDTILTMIGGYNFISGYGGYTSGDIFISTQPDLGPPDSGFTPVNGIDRVKQTFGYEYVLDVNWGTTKYNVLALNEDTYLKTVYYIQNESGNTPTSNPWAYDSGGTSQDSNLLFKNLGKVTDSGFSDWGDATTGHYAVSFDLTPFLNANNLWGSELYFHFTMGCGNDNLMGKATAPVPEPAIMLLFGTGLLGLAGMVRKRKNK